MADQTPPSFEEYQRQLQNELDSETQDISESTKGVKRAAETMQQASQQEQQQTQMLMESIQNQQREIQSLTQSVRMLVGDSEQISDPKPTGVRSVSMQTPGATHEPVLEGADAPSDLPQAPSGGGVLEGVDEAKGFAAFAGKEAARSTLEHGKRWTKQTAGTVYQGVSSVRGSQINPGSDFGERKLRSDRFIPGGVKDQILWNPAKTSQYSFGAYARGLEESAGRKGRNLVGGLAGFASNDMLGLGAAGGAASQALISSALGGGMLASGAGSVSQMLLGAGFALPGAMIGGALNPYLNPLGYGTSEMRRGQQLSAPANKLAGEMFRGRPGRYQKRMGFMERARLSNELRKQTYMEMSLSTNEMQTLQKGMIQGGSFWGVQSGEQFAQRFEQRMDSAKVVMKTFQKSAKEAAKIMVELEENLGAHRTGTHGNLIAQLSAASSIGAQPVGQALKRATQGAQAARQQGLMLRTGAKVSLGAQQMAGASTNMSYNLLSTVGGERGLSRLIQSKQMGYLSGMGGTLLAAGGGYESIGEGFKQTSQAIDTEGDLLEFMTNRHQRVQDRVDQMGETGIQAQHLQHLSSIAKQIAPDQDRATVMRQLLGGGPKAEAYVKSMKQLPGKIRRQMYSAARTRSDIKKDLLAEKYSIRGRITGGFRSAMKSLGAGAFAGGVTRAAGSTGAYFSRAMREITEGIQGYKRYEFTPEEAKKFEVSDDLIQSAEGSGGPIDAKRVDLMTSGEGKSAELYRNILQEGANPNKPKSVTSVGGGGGGAMAALRSGGKDQNKLLRAAGYAIKKGKSFKSKEELKEFAQSMSPEDKKLGAMYAAEGMEKYFSESSSEKHRMRLGITEKGGKSSEFSGIKPEQFGERAAQRLGITGYDESKVNKLVREKRFQSFIRTARSLYKKARKRYKKSQKNEGITFGIKQLNDMPLSKKLVEKYNEIKSMKDNDIKKMVDQVMSQMGISIEGNQVHMMDVVEARGKNPSRATELRGLTGMGAAAMPSFLLPPKNNQKGARILAGSGIEKMFKKAEAIGQTQQEAQYLSKGFNKAVDQHLKKFDIGGSYIKKDVDTLVGADKFSEGGEIASDIQTLMGFSDDKKQLQKLEKAGGASAKIASTLKKFESGKIKGEKARKELLTTLANAGVSAGPGVATDKGVDDAIGADTAEQITTVNSELVDTLVSVKDTLKTMRENE